LPVLHRKTQRGFQKLKPLRVRGTERKREKEYKAVVEDEVF